MRSYGLFISAIFLLVLCWAAGSPVKAQSPSAYVTLTDNGQGNITVDVSDPSDSTYGIKGVWHYGDTWASKGQGGGNLYELYYKASDQSLIKNLVSMVDWGWGRSRPIQTGIGGTGNTCIYAASTAPGQYGDYGFSDFICDNNASALPTAGSPYSAYVETDPASPDFGSAILTFHYTVHNQDSGREWYGIDKVWKIRPDKTIDLTIDWHILSDGYFAEPAMRAKWTRDRQWERWIKYGSDWQNPSYKYLLSTTNLASKYLAPGTGTGMQGRVVYESWDILNMFDPDWLAITGSTQAPAVKISGVPGFTFGPPAFRPTIEQSVIQNVEQFYNVGEVTLGEHASAWTSWWGGNPSYSYRYIPLSAGTTWTDMFKFNLIANNASLLDKTPTERYGPEITGVNVNDVDTTATVSWNTDVPATGGVEFLINNVWTVKGQNNSFLTSHSFYLTGLQPGFPYAYRVKSTDAAGHESVSFDTNFTKRMTDGPGGGDCKSVGKWDAATKTCTLTQDVVALTDNGIEIASDGVTLDGKEVKEDGTEVYHSIFGNGSGNGVFLNGRNGVTVRNVTVKNFNTGFYDYVIGNDGDLFVNNEASGNTNGFYAHGFRSKYENNSSTGNREAGFIVGYYQQTLEGNTASNNRWGYVLNGGSSTFKNNTATSNADTGIKIDGQSKSYVLTGNIMNNNKYNFDAGANDHLITQPNNIDTSNLVDGKPIYYLTNASNVTFDATSNAGTFYCIYCDNVSMTGTDLKNNRHGVYLYQTKNSRVENISISGTEVGIGLYGSGVSNATNNIITGNDIDSGDMYGIYLSSAIANQISYNSVRGTKARYNFGILVDSSQNNTFLENDVSTCTDGILLRVADGNSLLNNSINSNQIGIYLNESKLNTIQGNIGLGNSTGIQIDEYTNSDPNGQKPNALVNNNFSGGGSGIYVEHTNGITVTGNNVSNNGTGINLYCSNDSQVSGNLANSNEAGGFSIYGSNNLISDNMANLNKSDAGVVVGGCWQNDYKGNNNKIIGNTASFNNRSGLEVGSGTGNKINNNIANNNEDSGIALDNNSNTELLNNETNSNTYSGMRLQGINSSVLKGNKMSGNLWNFWLWGSSDTDYDNDIDTSNLTEGRPVYYIRNANNQVFDEMTNASTFYCINCSNVTITGINVTKNLYGIYLWNNHDVNLVNFSASDNLWGTMVNNSSHILVRNAVFSTIESGFGGFGLDLEASSFVTFENSTVTTATGYYSGLNSAGAGDNTVRNNNFTSGSIFVKGDRNTIYNNNFLGNIANIYSEGIDNKFSIDTPAGGNYWSNWTSPDDNHDGFVDNPYVFTGGQDNLPWTTQNGWQKGKPSLTLNHPTVYWASYVDYLMRKLSVTWTLTNNGTIDALNAVITDSFDTNGVSISMLSSPLPFTVSSNIPAYGGSASFTLVYDVPGSVGSWRNSLEGRAQDVAGTTYTYP